MAVNALSEETVLFRSRHRRDCQERGLVLDAVGIDNRIVAGHGYCELIVAGEDLTRARAEIDQYRRENRGWQIRTERHPVRSTGIPGVLGYIAVLLLVWTLDVQHAFGEDWRWAGRIDAPLIRAGEWWRTFTALTLHLDLPHLAANLVFGSVFGLFVGRLLGSGFGWFSILVAGAFGNALNAFIQPGEHTAIGASTAVFAALGLLAAYTWQRRAQLNYRWAYRLSPIFAGVAVLAYTGFGGERTDVLAHVTGFFAGVALGGIYGAVGEQLWVGYRGQTWSALATVVMLVFTWYLAFSAV